MDEVAGCVCHYYDPSICLRNIVVFYDSDSTQSGLLVPDVYSTLVYRQLGFWNFAILFICSAVAINYWIRFKYLNDYMQLKEPPLVKPDVNELHPDVNVNSGELHCASDLYLC
jgi:hypothetical protein